MTPRLATGLLLALELLACRQPPPVPAPPDATGVGDAASADARSDGGVDAGPAELPGPCGATARPRRVAAGGTFTCDLRAGVVSCWGANEVGQLGDGSRRERSVAVPVALSAPALSIAAGSSAACAVLEDRDVECWGRLGPQWAGGSPRSRDALRPRRVEGVHGATEVAVGAFHACARLQDGAVLCWGRNALGALGGPDPCTGIFTEECAERGPRRVGVGHAVALSAGAHHACAVLADGSLWCWGAPPGVTTPSAPLRIASPPVWDVAGGDVSTVACAVLQSGEVTCWGRGLVDPGAWSGEPVVVPGLSSVAQVAVGAGHACATHCDGSVTCWGAHALGQLGRGDVAGGPPARVVGLAGAVAVACGAAHACAITESGDVHCWGWTGHGQVGGGRSTFRDLPASVPGASGVRGVAVGGLHACAVMGEGEVACWGANGRGESGVASPAPTVGSPTATGVADATRLDASSRHTCAVAASSRVRCWGANECGQLGVEPSLVGASASPVEVPGVSAVEIAGGEGHTCALAGDGRVSCWGCGDEGQLGDGAPVERRGPGPPAASPADAVSVAAGHDSTYVVSVSGLVQAFGDNRGGVLGDGSDFDRPEPVSVSGITDAIRVAAGPMVQDGLMAGAHTTCALTRRGTVMCWGLGSRGQLGNGAAEDRATPVEVSGLSSVVGVSVGGEHVCALEDSGSVACWGANSLGQLGVGSVDDSGTPLRVAGISDAVAVSAGVASTCVVHAGGALSCWGSDASGQLGQGTEVRQSLPSRVPR